MAHSGVTVDDEVVDIYQEIKTKKLHGYATFKLNDKMDKIIPNSKGQKGATHEEFVSCLSLTEPLYCVLDYQYVKEGTPNSKIFFINWCPEGCKIKNKMVHSSSKEALKAKLVGFAHELQATDMDEVSRENFEAKVNKK